jgi:hypothetical protein
MKEFDSKNYWLSDDFVKKSVSERKLIEKWVVELGEEIIEKMIKDKMSKLISESVDDNLYKRGFREKVIYRKYKK